MQNSTLQIRVTDALRESLQKRAGSFGVSISDYLRHLIIEDLKKAEKEETK